MEFFALLGVLIIVAALRHEYLALSAQRRRALNISVGVLLIAGVLFALTGCKAGAVKPDLPDSTPVVPRIVYVDRIRYVQIPANLTQEQPVAEGTLAQCPDVAAARKASLKKTNAQLREIRTIRGTVVKP